MLRHVTTRARDGAPKFVGDPDAPRLCMSTARAPPAWSSDKTCLQRASTEHSDRRVLLDEVSVSDDADEAVRDRYHAAFLITYLLGVGSLFPWNALITPIEYFQLRLAGSEFESSFESVLTTSFTLCSFSTIVVLQRVQRIVPLRVLLIGSMLLLFAVFAFTCGNALVPLGLDDAALHAALRAGATGQFVALVVCAALAGVGQGFFTGVVMSYASVYGDGAYLRAVSGGQGVAGVTVTLGSLAVSLPGIFSACKGPAPPPAAPLAALGGGAPGSHERDVVQAAAVYFGAACAMQLASLLGFFLLER